MRSQFLAGLLVFFFSQNLTGPDFAYFVVWNVGQGQWLSFIDHHVCVHFDMGGEYFPARAVRQNCGRKRNVLYLSHSDKDHIQFISWGIQHLPNLCIWHLPREMLDSKSEFYAASRKYAKRWPLCQQEESFVRELTTAFSENLNRKIKNELSYVFGLYTSREWVLIPGDSTKQAEKYWSQALELLRIRKLVLGHHGSNTSTHNFLLNHLPQLLQAVASARTRRYGHPHRLVLSRLKAHGVAVIKTEDWGSVAFEIR